MDNLHPMSAIHDQNSWRNRFLLESRLYLVDKKKRDPLSGQSRK